MNTGQKRQKWPPLHLPLRGPQATAHRPPLRIKPRILPRRRRTLRPRPRRLAPRRLRLQRQLSPQTHNPLMLQQLHGGRPRLGIPLKASFQKVDPGLAQQIGGRQLRGVPLRNVIHDGPLVVHVCPGTTTRYHFEDDASEGPDVNGAVAA